MSTPAQWELGGAIMDESLEHPSLRTITNSWQTVIQRLKEIQEFSANLKKVGVGRTEDPNLIVARLVPALREHAEVIATVASQLEERLK